MFRILFKFSLPPTPTHSRCQKALTFFKFHNGVFGADDGCWYEFRCCDPAQVGAKKVFQFICGKPAFSFLFLSPRPARTSPSACSAASPRRDSGPSTRGATTCTSSTGWRSTAGRERSSRRASKRETVNCLAGLQCVYNLPSRGHKASLRRALAAGRFLSFQVDFARRKRLRVSFLL